LCQLLHSNGYITDHLEINEPGIIKCLREKFGKVIPKPIIRNPVKEEEKIKSLKENRSGDNF